ncbi:MAG: pantoate--beta-alanine ligase [Chromatiales bacterium]|nr:pantoate--beta-alanine ligase [Chromatiales bacterium]
MKTVRTIASLRENLRSWRGFGETIALVPTMGNLHAGHLSLVDVARALADRVVVSIFVNPTQFGPGEDFAAYPRTLDKDRRQLTRANVDILFAPPVEEIYPDREHAGTVVSVPGLSGILCGQFRPGHFDGVASVVTRLFNIVQPDSAVFGQKDYQQLLVIRRLQADLHLPVKIVAAPTAREPDGLALSSRNQYLDAAQRAMAPGLHRTLAECAGALRQGRRDFDALEARGMAGLVAAGFRPDYFVIRTAADLGAPAAANRNLVVLAAGHLGRARLIDNVLVDLT